MAHYRATQGRDRRLYEAAKKCGDHLCETFGPPPKRNWIYGHPGMGLALCRLNRPDGRWYTRRPRTFEPVTTGALRLEVQFQPDQAAGILQWPVECVRRGGGIL